MNRTLVSVFALCAMGVPGLAHAQYGARHGMATEEYSLRVAWDRWNAKLDSQVAWGSADSPGTLIDPVLDLGIEDDNTWGLHGDMQFRPGHKLRVSYTKIKYEGDTSIGSDIVFGETLFNDGSQVLSSLKGALWSGGYEFDFSRGDWGFLGVTLGGQFLDVDGLLVAPAEGERELGTLRQVLPTLGLAGRFYGGSRFSVTGEIAGMSLGSRGWVYEAKALARIHLSDRLAVEGGYRVLQASGEDQDDTLDVKIDGLTFGVELSL